MGYIVKLLDSNTYFISDDNGDVGTTESKEQAIKIGQFGDFEEADLSAQYFSKDMARGIDYEIIEV
ncbi:hypothetical protein [Acinetobacter sp. YQ_14]|uniref:hypothetical protein n=1 Tax=Acinetobacter sp. YQ_14 TaxID=3367236 RepID=UPI00370D163F